MQTRQVHAASDKVADVHCLELRTGDFVQFVPSTTAGSAALDPERVRAPCVRQTILAACCLPAPCDEDRPSRDNRADFFGHGCTPARCAGQHHA